MPSTESVEKMFDSIAPEYDNLNHLLSMNIDKYWRKTAVKNLLPEEKASDSCEILDIACGTGDFSMAVARHYEHARIIGVDISEGMLEKGRGKVASSNLENRISLIKGDCLHLPFKNDRFDGICVAFGVRNFEFLQECIKEMLRVLKPGGRLVILELSMPKSRIIRAIYKVYFTGILPLIGKSISGDRKAYRYLPYSVIRFPAPEVFMEILKGCDAGQVFHKSLSFGICRLYSAIKKQENRSPNTSQ